MCGNKTKMKILFVHQVGLRGGAGIMLNNILCALDKSEFDPIVICPDGDYISEFKKSGARVVVSERPIYQFSHYTGYHTSIFHPAFIGSAWGMWKDAKYWTEYIKSMDVDLVWLNALTLAPMVFSVNKAGVKVACMVQETAVKGWTGLRTKWLYSILSQRMDGVVFISQFDRERARCSSKFIEVIPNWVDLEEYDPSIDSSSARELLGIPQDVRVILMMGGVAKIKGTLELISAVSRLKMRSKVILLVAGYTSAPSETKKKWYQRLKQRILSLFAKSYLEKVFSEIDRLGVKDTVRFIGMRDDVAQIYAASDILVFPATKPHQARPVLEAGAMKKPVVVPYFSSLAEFIRHDYNGLVYEAKSVQALADALDELLFDPDKATRLGINNFAQTCEIHNKVVNEKKVVDFLSKILKD